MADEDFPVLGLHRGQPVPNLGKTPPARWRELLSPLTQSARREAVGSAPNGQVGDALVLVAELELEDGARERALRGTVDQPPRLIAPCAQRPRSLAGRQVNVRLRWRDFESLQQAADIAAVSPTQLARIFIVNGTQRLLYEHRCQQAARPRESQGTDADSAL